jgi:TolB-like protein
MTTTRSRSIVLLVALAATSPARPVLAQKVLAEGVEDLAGQIAASVAKEQKAKVAVLPFRELDGRQTMLGMFLAEELVTNLFARGLDIVERTMLDRVLGEIKLGQSGVIDPETAREVGKVAGVDALVSGTITDLSSYVALNCRLIDAQTGRVFAAAQVKIAKDADVIKILEAPAPVTTQPARSEGASVRESVPQARAELQKELEGFRFELKICRAAADSLQCELMITNNGPDRRLTIETAGESRLIDSSGNEHLSRPDGSALGSSQGRGFRGDLDSYLVSGVPIRGQVTFQGSTEGILLATVVELSVKVGNTMSVGVGGFTGQSRLRVQFRNVPLTR